jgi:peptidoglycan hydrolase-like protein with peptidoglycan-binding domain
MLGRKTEGPEDHHGTTKHQRVVTAQQALKDKGHDPGTIDGQMGPRTRAALADYQKAEGLKQTGRLDDETRTKLGI